MRIAPIAAMAGTLLLASCSPSTPVAERDETAFLSEIRGSDTPLVYSMSDGDLVNLGDAICAYAEDAGVSLTEALEDSVRMLSAQGGGDDSFLLTVAVGDASDLLCPDLAG